jgi:hypothetical protein
MGTYPPPGPGGVGRRIEEAIELIEMELRGAVMYVNDAIVPHVRRESITAMRTVADTLRNLADRFDQPQPHPSQPGPAQTAQPPTPTPPAADEDHRS